MSSNPVSIAVAGAGLIGLRHARLLRAEPTCHLAGIADPDRAAQGAAAELGAPVFASLDDLLNATKPDGLIVATPNRLHVEQGLAAIAAGVPVLVEKPLAETRAEALRLVEAGERADVPVLVGHHRRHNPLLSEARARIEAGVIGHPVAAHGMFWLGKPDAYFDVTWRREAGAGPILINLSHDIDALRFLLGEIDAVAAMASNAIRGFPVEDTAAILLRFRNGVLGTLTLSDAVVSPWSWEMTSGENAAYARTDQSCYFIAGTAGSLALPGLDVWSQAGTRDWWRPMASSRVFVPDQDPLVRQIRQFAAVIRGEEAPLAPGREGLRTLAAIEAVRRSADTGQFQRVEGD